MNLSTTMKRIDNKQGPTVCSAQETTLNNLQQPIKEKNLKKNTYMDCLYKDPTHTLTPVLAHTHINAGNTLESPTPGTHRVSSLIMTCRA